MVRQHALRDGYADVVTAAIAGAAHGVPVAALLPAAAVEAARGRVLRAVAVTSHAALFVIAAWIHLCQDVVFLGDAPVCRN